MNAQVAKIGESAATPFTANDARAHVQRIQQIMAAVMKEETHYGKIPGTPKPTLYKAGAEVLCTAFHIAPSYRAEELSDHDRIRYRVTCIGTHQGSGMVLGEGMGEASSNEEKYKWRKTNRPDFEAADPERRRIKHGYNSSTQQEYEIYQIRTEPDDVANTVLKMACKRAQVAMTLNVLAASDIFSQDLEDLPEGLVTDDTRRPAGNPTRGNPPAGNRGKPRTQAPQSKGASGSTPNSAQPQGQPNTSAPAAQTQAAAQATKPSTGQQNVSGQQSLAITCVNAKQLETLAQRMEDFGVSPKALLAKFGLQSLAELPADRFDEAIGWIRDSN